jgi:hypothetical protein
MLSFIKLLVWGILWLPAWVVAKTAQQLQKRQSRDNCLSWALRKWNTHGGYLVIRWCRSNRVAWIKWPHFLWLPPDFHADLRHYVPRDEADRHVLPSPLFVGRVQQGDPPTTLEN